jgi:hypothetical protein
VNQVNLDHEVEDRSSVVTDESFVIAACKLRPGVANASP